MCRAKSCLLVLTGCLLAIAASLPAAEPGDPAPPAAKKPAPRKVRDQLAERIDFPGFEGNTPLKEALLFLSERYDLPILLDEDAFAMIGVQKAGEAPVQLPRMANVRLATVLRMLLVQVKGDVHTGVYLLKPDGVVATTSQELLQEVLGSEGKPTDLLGRQPGQREAMIAPEFPGVQQVVSLDYHERPLREALKELADREGINIVVDARANEKAKATVTATMNNVLATTAVRLLADMADLKVLVANNVLYVTTKENARGLEQDRQKRQGPLSE